MIQKVTVCLIVCLLATAAQAALTYDTKARIPATALTTTTSAASTSYTCGANAEVLVVMVLYAGTTQRTGGAPTYNSVALQQVSTKQGVTEASCELWYMLQPPVSQSLTVAVPNDNGVTMWVYVASGNAAEDYTCALDSSGTRAMTADDPNVPVTTVAAGTLIFAVVATGDNTFAPSARTGTLLYEEDIAAYGGAGQYYVMAGTGLQSMSWTEATSDDYGAIAVAFKEVGAFARTVNDSEGITDAHTDVQGISRTIADSEGITDARTLVRDIFLTISNSLGLTDLRGLMPFEVTNQITSWTDFEGGLCRNLARTSNGDLHCVYRRSISGKYQICYAKSTDEGQTWAETQLTSDAYNHDIYTSIAVDSADTIHVIFYGPNADSPTYSQILYMKYDGSWSGITALTTTATGDGSQQRPFIAVDSNDYLHVAWKGKPEGDSIIQIRYRKYTDSWQTIVDLTSDVTYGQDLPSLAIAPNDNIHVFWYAQETPGQIKHRVYTTSWQSPETVVAAYDPACAVDSSGNLHLVYTKSNTGIYYKLYNGSWQDEVLLEDASTYDQEYPGISIDASDNLHVVWAGIHSGSGGIWQIRYKLNNGSWQTTENLTNRAVDQSLPTIMWAYHPIVSGARTNRPATGYAFAWAADDSAIRYGPSDDLTWSGASNDYVRTVNDSLGLTDAQVLVRAVVRAFDESMGVTDARDKVWDALRTLAEALGITDERIASQGYIRAISDSLGLTDTWTEAELKVIADALGITDETLRTFIVLRTLEDSLAMSDSPTTVSLAIRIAESLAMTDIITALKSQEKIIADALGITDSAARLYVGLRTIDDLLGMTDAQTKVSVMVKVIADSLGLSDSRTVSVGFVRTFANDLGLTDSATEAEDVSRTMNNDLGLTDASSESEGKVFSESLGMTDAASRLSLILRTIANDLGITDSMDYQFSGGYARVINDSLGLTDARVLVRSIVCNFDDSMGFTDSQTRVSETLRTLADSLGLTDAQVSSYGFGRTLTDSLGLTDAQTPVQVIVRSFSDPLGLTDERILTATVLRAFDDSLGLTDAASRVSVISRSVSDSEGLTDVASDVLTPAVAGLVSRPQATSVPPFVTIFMRTVLDDPNAAAARTTLGVIYWSSVPASATAEGTPGEVAYDSGYFYICVADDTWKRVQIVTWP